MSSRRRRSRARIRVLSSVGVFAGTAVLVGGAGMLTLHSTLNGIHRIDLPGLVQVARSGHGPGQPSASAAPNGGLAPMTILLVGNNTRTGLSPSEAAQFGSANEVPGARSDVTMLLHLDPVKGPSILSIPRDLFVPLPPKSASGPVGKIDAALNDGPEHLIETITHNLGIPIDHFVELNFDGFQRVVDALGGLSMYFPMPLRDTFTGLDVKQPGCRQLNGWQALAVVRSRHIEYQQNGKWLNDPLSDLSRIRRNHEFLSVLAKTVKNKGLTNPVTAGQVLSKLVHQITVDNGLSNSLMLKILERYRSLDLSAVPMLTLPVTLVTQYHYRNGAYGDVAFPSQPEDQQVISDFLHTTPVPAAPPSSIEIVDYSGAAGLGRTVASGLRASGLTVRPVRYAPSPARTSETVVRYAPGEVTLGSQVLAQLSGAALMYQDGQVASGTVQIDVGSVIAVAHAAQTSTASATTAATTAATNAGASAGKATAPAKPAATTPTPNGQSITDAVTPLASFDPTACP